jgi:hypothetical protein
LLLVDTKDVLLLLLVVVVENTTLSVIGLQVKGVDVALNRMKTAPVSGVTQKPLLATSRVSEPSEPMVHEDSGLGMARDSENTMYE